MGKYLTFGVLLAVLGTPSQAPAQTAERVLVVVNDNSPLSKGIGEYYVRKRGIPPKNLCHIRTTVGEEISHEDFEHDIAGPIAEFLRKNNLVEEIFYIVTTGGIPLKIPLTEGSAMDVDEASVDSELTLLYSDMKNLRLHETRGAIPNPFFGQSDKAFSHPEFPIYLVTRLEAYDYQGALALVDRSLVASNRGKFVIDLSSSDNAPGNNWLRTAAGLLPKDRVIFDESAKVLTNLTDVIGFASWGSNDQNRHQRLLGFQWLPGAIMTEYVSTNGRTFITPPDTWNISNWESPKRWFAGSPQTLTADYIREGVTGASGHVFEPYLMMTPRPDLLLPAYYSGRNLAESYYLSIRGLSWQNIVIGDPLCSIGKPQP